jgi:hypothetical protein
MSNCDQGRSLPRVSHISQAPRSSATASLS